METAIGVFASRERAENALGYLLENGVPEDAIVYLTRSETEAVALGKKIGGFAGVLQAERLVSEREWRRPRGR